MQDGSMWTYLGEGKQGLCPCGPAANFPVPCPYMVPTPLAAMQQLGLPCPALPCPALPCPALPCPVCHVWACFLLHIHSYHEVFVMQAALESQSLPLYAMSFAPL